MEGTGLFDSEWRVSLVGEIGDGLTEVVVVVDDGVNCESEAHRLSAVCGGANPISDGKAVSPLASHEILTLSSASPSLSAPSALASWSMNRGTPFASCSGVAALRAPCDLSLAAIDQVRAVVQRKLMHGSPGGACKPADRLAALSRVVAPRRVYAESAPPRASRMCATERIRNISEKGGRTVLWEAALLAKVSTTEEAP